MRFVLAAGIWCMQAVNNRQSHSYHSGEGGKWKRKKFLFKSIIRRAHCVQKPFSNKRCKCTGSYEIKREDSDLWAAGQGN